jgi:type VI secretion system protein ImpE
MVPATAKELLAAGRVREAERQLTANLRERPSDIGSRVFLFELLCFAGDYARATKQLSVLADSNKDAQTGAIVYFAALHAEQLRHGRFQDAPAPSPQFASPSGRLNGVSFQELRDADPDIGARLEVFAAGAYLWLPFEHISSIAIAPPARLRDTLWTPAMVETGPAFDGKDLGEVLVPAIYPFSWKDPDEDVWLGRKTVWAADDEGKEYPSGQKVLLVDGEEFPFLEVRSIEFDAASVTPEQQLKPPVR